MLTQDSINISDKIESTSLKHSHLLLAKVQQLITQQGGINFAEFMQQALYAPGLGYYSGGLTKFGLQGDFITAPEIGIIFATCVATQIQELFNPLNAKNIIELGAGSGKLAGNLCRILTKNNIQLDTYFILEPSAELQTRQRNFLKQEFADVYPKIVWLQNLPDKPIEAIILANEVIDAMPVQRFCWQQNTLREIFVINNNEQSFALSLQPPSPSLAKYFTEHNIASLIGETEQPYVSEINLWINPWIKSLAQFLNKGAILLFDYGFSRAEYYHPQRNTGTLMCHYKHQSNPNPFANIGLQDITAHVDFTCVAEAAVENALTVQGFTNQASFLLNCGLDLVQQPDLQQRSEINLLTSPAEMGELFKVMLLTKGIDLSARGFSQFDKLHTL